MRISLQTPVSGMRASRIRHDVTAHDVANVNTPGYRERSAIQTDRATGGTDVAAIRRNSSGDPARSNTDLAGETAEQIVNRHTYAANARALKVQDEMAGEIIDLAG